MSIQKWIQLEVNIYSGVFMVSSAASNTAKVPWRPGVISEKVPWRPGTSTEKVPWRPGRILNLHIWNIFLLQCFVFFLNTNLVHYGNQLNIYLYFYGIMLYIIKIHNKRFIKQNKCLKHRKCPYMKWLEGWSIFINIFWLWFPLHDVLLDPSPLFHLLNLHLFLSHQNTVVVYCYSKIR